MHASQNWAPGMASIAKVLTNTHTQRHTATFRQHGVKFNKGLVSVKRSGTGGFDVQEA